MIEKGKKLSATRLHRTWTNIKQRCYNNRQSDYKYYGGRGITICEEWKNDFKAFYDWSMANGYRDDLTIDRIDTDGNYEPSNCRWVSMKEQCNNKRCCITVNINGIKKSLKEIAREKNIKYTTLYMRYRSGKRGEELYASR